MSSKEDARLAAESVTRQARFQAWFVFALAEPDEVEGYVVRMYTLTPVRMIKGRDRIRGVLVVPVIHRRDPRAEALAKAILAGKR